MNMSQHADAHIYVVSVLMWQYGAGEVSPWIWGGGLLLLRQSKHSVDGAATAEAAKQLQFCLF